ncbi:cyclophilin-like fold protein [Spirosoma koreense]
MACKSANELAPDPAEPATNDNSQPDPMKNRLLIRIGSRLFTATLLNNATVAEFKTRLPLTVSMSELNGNEKLYRFQNKLTARASNPGTIDTGDLMLYGSDTLVLFYQRFPTPYSYTRLGKIDDPTGLATAVGTGSISVTFELE